jgi:hypothetical protein
LSPAVLTEADYWRTLVLALLVFWLPGAAIWMILGWRAYREFQKLRDLHRIDAEATAAEGYPPPDPPTTDHPPTVKR